MEDRNIRKIVSQEEFNKLSQLDRIEYRQKEDRINKQFSPICSILLAIIIFCGSLLIISLLSLMSNFSMRMVSQIGSKIIPLYLVVTIIALILAVIGDTLLVYRHSKAIEDLKSQYFNVK